MNEHTQISLFFPERNIYEPVKVANTLLEAFPQLGQPLILPYNIGPGNDEPNTPVAIFNRSEEMHLVLSFSNISITLFNDNRSNYERVLKDLYNSVKPYGFTFSRIGYVNNILMPEDEVVKFKKRIFLDETIKNSLEFETAWYNKVKIDKLEVNYWQRYFTNKDISDSLFVTHDLNTQITDNLIVDYEFSILFIKSINKLLENEFMLEGSF